MDFFYIFAEQSNQIKIIMKTIISKQREILNGNEAYLIGVNKLGIQIWLEVLTPTQIKCEDIPSENINLNNLLTQKVFNETNGTYLSHLLMQYAMKINFFKRHPEAKEYAEGIEMQILVKDILDIVKPI